MTSPTVTVVVGNPKPRSRTRFVAETLASHLAGVIGADTTTTTTIDLADYAGRLFDWGDQEVIALNTAVAASTLAVVASPTYKATYTGLLKAFLDRYGNDGLCGVVAVPVMVGAAPLHAMAPEVFLRPLLVELGATVPCRALYVMESEVENVEAVVKVWAGPAGPLVCRAVADQGRERRTSKSVCLFRLARTDSWYRRRRRNTNGPGSSTAGPRSPPRSTGSISPCRW
jgi:FMN reductase